MTDHEAAALAVGEVVEVEVGPVAHGGHFVARHEGRVIFVRHALTGERVRVQVTEDSGSFLRGDAIEVLEASAARVEAPCPLAHPDGCGGCDFQHVAVAEQRRLKGTVVEEQLRRLAGIERSVEVEPVPNPHDPEDTGLHWRTRMQYVAVPSNDQTGLRGLRKYRSHDVVVVPRCPIAAPGARETVAASSGSGPRTHQAHDVPGEGTVTERVGPHAFEVAADGFWQVHPGAPQVLVATVMRFLQPRPGEHALDLYAGVGLFSAFLADEVGESGAVTAIEGDRLAVAHARENLPPWAEVRTGRVDREIRHVATADVVVLDPPRSGAKRQVVRAITALDPRAVAYVACDPAALARDVGYFAEQGYRLEDLRALDLFPMTHHVECVALLTKTGSDLR